MADINTNELDFERIASLLSVVHQCAAVGPQLTHIGGAAMSELTKINDSIKVASRKNQLPSAQPLDLSGKPVDDPEPDEELEEKLETPSVKRKV